MEFKFKSYQPDRNPEILADTKSTEDFDLECFFNIYFKILY